MKTRMQQVLVTGASGFVGRHLCARLLAQGVQVIALQHRQPPGQGQPGLRVVRSLDELAADLPLDAVVNLAGARILGRPWTVARRNELLASRVLTTAAAVRLMERLQRPPAVLVSASAIGYYGVRGDEPLDESAPPQAIFQSQLCQRWEEAAALAGRAGARVVTLRFGVVLGTDGGALPALLRPARLGLAAVMGDGSQGMPWIHIEDAVRLIEHALDDGQLQGAVNAVAPGHVTQRQFQRTLTQVLHRPLWLRVPAGPLRLLLGEMSQLLVAGQHVVPARCLAQGFRFEFPDLQGALTQLLCRA